MPPKNKASVTSSAKKKVKSKSPVRPARAADKVDDLADLLNRSVISREFLPFTLKAVFPTMVMQTCFINGSKYCIVDMLVLPLHTSRFLVDLDPNGTSVHVGIIIPSGFMSASRIGNEDALQGDRDGLVMAHTDCAQWIANHHQDGIVSSHPTQEVILPFACEAAFSRNLVFDVGDYLLYQVLVATGNPNPHQMMIISSVSPSRVLRRHPILDGSKLL